MAGTFWLASLVFPIGIAVMLALLSRILLTGALHEDGLADFCDGFGAGGSRERILGIMKDSHIGTYGVLGLIFYYFLAWNALCADYNLSDPKLLVFIMLAADPWCKYCSSQIINFLPYCRKSSEAKNQTVYARMRPSAIAIGFFFGALPLMLLPHYLIYWAALVPIFVCVCLFWLMKSKIGGYTGDCCGATFLISELSFFLICAALINPL